MNRTIMRITATTFGLFGGLLLLAGCTGSHDETPAKPDRPVFNHAAHADADVECATCHATATSGEHATLPSMDACLECHESKPDNPKLLEMVFERKKAGQPAPWDRPLGPGKDVNFSHAKHATQNVACIQCHGDVMKKPVMLATDRPKMADCLACHNKGKAEETACSVCHRELRKDGKPSSHMILWKQRHGQLVREEGTEGETQNCMKCHKESWCVGCHQDTKPSSHNGGWSQSTHAVAAAMDRQACATCHQTDYCERCHSETAPRNHNLSHWIYLYHGEHAETEDETCQTCHTPGFCTNCHSQTPPLDHYGTSWPQTHGLTAAVDAPRCATCHTTGTCAECHAVRTPSTHTSTWFAPTNNHCFGCHLPLSSADQSCSACHSSLSGHSGASNQPAWHVAGMDCRSCHGAGAPLPHVDNGDSCTSCHQ